MSTERRLERPLRIAACALVLGLGLAMAVGVSSCGTGGQVEDQTWILRSYRNAQGATTPARADVRVDARFSAGRVNGSSGCNTYSGSARMSDGALEIGTLTTTEKTCLPSIMEIERAYLAGLEHAAGAAIADATGLLVISDAEGDTILTFAAEKPHQLPGSSWKLASYRSRAGELVPTLDDTSVSISFDEDGSFAGLAGCNSYWGSYVADDDRLSLGSLDATRLSCPQPAGIMDQERTYLEALQATAAFTIVGDTLELRASDDGLVATFDIWKPPSGG